MNSSRRIFAVLGATLALCASSVLGQSPVPAPAQPALDAASERWHALSPEERERLRERYERYRALSAEERAELAARAHHLKETGARLQRELPPVQHERLDRLPPERRREVVRELVEGEARDIAQRIRSKLPDEWVAELERAAPEERLRFLVEFKRQQKGRMAHIALQQLGQRLDLSQAEIELYKALPQPEREAKVLELRKRAAGTNVEEFGLPHGITPEQWDAWQDLPPEAFFQRMTDYLRRRRAERSEAERSADGLRPVDRTPRSEEALRRLAEAVRLRPDEVIDLADLEPEQRQARIFEATRDRALKIIREKRLLPPDRIQELANAPPPAFFAHVRRILAPLHLGERPIRPPRIDDTHPPRAHDSSKAARRPGDD